MAIKRSEHCRNPERHAGHVGVERWWDGVRLEVYCDGTPEFLARELQREANPPPAPPNPPRPKIDWANERDRAAGLGACGVRGPLPLNDAQRLYDAALAVITDEQDRRSAYYSDTKQDDLLAADRKRLTSDLAGLTRALSGLRFHSEYLPGLCGACTSTRRHAWPCPDARRYTEQAQDSSENLRRTAAVYEVTL